MRICDNLVLKTCFLLLLLLLLLLLKENGYVFLKMWILSMLKYMPPKTYLKTVFP